MYSAPQDDSAEEQALDRAWLALDQGQPEEVLLHLREVSAENGERAVLEVYLWLDQIDWLRAAPALERAQANLEQDDPLLLAARAEWELVHWQMDAARALFERAAAAGASPRVFDRLALCADFFGDYEAADRWLLEAQTADPENGPPPARLSAEEFEAEVARAAEELPDEFRGSLEEIPVLIDPMPDAALVQGENLQELPPDLLGLFVGPSALDQGHDISGEVPARIHLFQRNLERACGDPSHLRDEIRVTLYHELAHALGFDEAGVEEMGLE